MSRRVSICVLIFIWFSSVVFAVGNSSLIVAPNGKVGDIQESEIQEHKHIEALSGHRGAVTPGYGYSDVRLSSHRLEYRGDALFLRHPYTNTEGGSVTRPRNISVNYCIRA